MPEGLVVSWEGKGTPHIGHAYAEACKVRQHGEGTENWCGWYEKQGIAEKQAWEVRCAEISLCRQQRFIPEISSASAILEIIVVFCGLSWMTGLLQYNRYLVNVAHLPPKSAIYFNTGLYYPVKQLGLIPIWLLQWTF